MVALDSFFFFLLLPRSLIEHARREREREYGEKLPDPYSTRQLPNLSAGSGWDAWRSLQTRSTSFFPNGTVGRFHRLLASLFTQTGLGIAWNRNFSRSPTRTDFRGTLNFISKRRTPSRRIERRWWREFSKQQALMLDSPKDKRAISFFFFFLSSRSKWRVSFARATKEKMRRGRDNESGQIDIGKRKRRQEDSWRNKLKK